MQPVTGGVPRPSGSETEESLELYRSLVRACPDAVTATDLEGLITAVSHRTLELYGSSTEADILGRSALDFIVPDEHARALENLGLTLEAGVVGPVEYTMLRRDGSHFIGELCASVVRDHAGVPRGFVATTRDVTEARRAQAALAESEARYRTLVELSPDPVVILSDGRYRFVNAAFTRLFGYTDEHVRAGLSFLRLVPEHEKAGVLARYSARMAGEELPANYRVDLVTKGGQIVPCETSARLIQYEGHPADLVIIRDVTERERAAREQRRLEARIQKSQKLESLGLLAGGVAHDFNNLLTAMLGNLELLRRAPRDALAASETLGTVETAVVRARELCNQLLEYAGRTPRRVQRIELNALVDETLDLLAAALPPGVKLVRRLYPDLPPIRGNATQLRQAVMNLLTNAADAVTGRDGTVTVATGRVDCVDPCLLEHAVASHTRPGPHVYVEITDTGCGMDEATLQRILDPFFTTKASGRGLGLAAVQSCVVTHGGALCVQSDPGVGSAFRLLLPLPTAAGEER